MAYTKKYDRINWVNEVDGKVTAMGASNFNKMDYALYEHDKQLVEVDGSIELVKESINEDKAEIEEIKKNVDANHKELSEEVFQLSSDIDSVVGNVKSPNIFNKYDERIIRGEFINYLGDWESNTNFGESYFIEVEPNKGYIVYSGNGLGISVNTAKVWYDENKVQIGISKETEINVAPENAKYMRIAFNLKYLDGVMVVESTTVVDKYIPFSPMEYMSEINEDVLTSVEKMNIHFRTANLFDKNHPENVFGKFINKNGNWETISTHGETHFMEVEPNKNYVCYFGSEFKVAASIPKVWYDENKTSISISYGEGISKAPENAKYLRIPFNISYIDTYMVVESFTEINEYIPYYQYENVAKKSHWYNKKWYAYGTSLTSISQGKYVPFVCELSGLNVTNKGVPGGALVSNRNIFDALMDNTDGKIDADLITIEVGANDSTAPLGEITSMDTDTFCGALNTCIKNVLMNCPKAQVVVMPSTRGRYKAGDNTDLFTLDHQSANGMTIYERDKAIREVAFANGVYFIPFNALGLGLFREQSSDLYNLDNIHHTELGGYNLAHGVWSYLENIPLWYTEIK